MQTAKIFNALLEETKKARPDDPIVAVIEPAESIRVSPISSALNTTLRTASAQLLAAVRGS